MLAHAFGVLLLLFWAAQSAQLYNITHWKVGMYLEQEGTQERAKQSHLNIYSPTSPGSYPVVLFCTGNGGLAPALLYDDIQTKIAEQGVVLVAATKINDQVESEMLKIFSSAYNWIANNIRQEFENHFKSGEIVPDIENNLYFLSHSWGGYISTVFLLRSCGDKAPIRGQIMMDPIDGLYWNKPALEPPKSVNFTIPTIIIAHGTLCLPPPISPRSAPAQATPIHWNSRGAPLLARPPSHQFSLLRPPSSRVLAGGRSPAGSTQFMVCGWRPGLRS